MIPIRRTTILSGGEVKSKYLFYDDFDDGVLDSNKWVWIRESPGKWDEGVTESGKLNIKTQNKELWDSTNNSPVLRSKNPIVGDFTAECDIKISPVRNFQRGTLVIYQDDDNYLNLGYEYGDGGAIFSKLEVNGNPNEHDVSADLTQARYKIQKSENNYKLYIDTGNGYTLFKEWTAAFNPVYIALLSESYEGDSSDGVNVLFDNLKVTKL